MALKLRPKTAPSRLDHEAELLRLARLARTILHSGEGAPADRQAVYESTHAEIDRVLDRWQVTR